MQPCKTHCCSGGRTAFTLIEMLIVMAIIGVLAMLGVGAAIRLQAAQEEAQTKTLLQKLTRLLDAQWKAVIDDANDEIRRGMIPPGVMQMANKDNERARVIYIKLRLKREFPTTFAELLNPVTGPAQFVQSFSPPSNDNLAARPSYKLALTQAGLTASNPPDPREPAACLVLALSVARRGVAVDTEALGQSHLALDFIGAGGQVPLPYLVDPWKTPLAFYRWPTGYPDVDNSNPEGPPGGVSADPQNLRRDPQDKGAKLTTLTWWSRTSSPFDRANFETICHTVSNTANSAPLSRYLVPVIVSWGKNQSQGLDSGLETNYRDMSPINQNSNANIYSFNLR